MNDASFARITKEHLEALLNDFAETATLLANAYARLEVLGDDAVCTFTTKEYEQQLQFEMSMIAQNHQQVAVPAGYLENRFSEWKAGDDSAFDDMRPMYVSLLTDFLAKYLNDPILIDETIERSLDHAKKNARNASSLRAWVFNAAYHFAGLETASATA